MARSIAQIQAQIIAFKNAQPDLAGLNSTSNRAIWLLWTFITASAIGIFEQLLDAYVAIIEAIVGRSAAASVLWVQDKMFKFQYSATDPQIVQLIETVPQYPTVDAALRITTACSVTTDTSNAVNIKLAKGNPYVAFSGPELSAAQDYINTIGVAGINYVAQSLDADKIFIDALIYYKGQYSAVIKLNVIATLNAYLQRLSIINFNGSLKMSDLEQIIRNVEGVNDVVLNNVRGRADTTAFAFSTYFIQNTALINRLWNSTAGYIVQETTGGQTFSDSLQFVAQ